MNLLLLNDHRVTGDKENGSYFIDRLDPGNTPKSVTWYDEYDGRGDVGDMRILLGTRDGDDICVVVSGENRTTGYAGVFVARCGDC